MAYILNLETSTDICSVAIGRDEELLCLRETQEPYQHASQITLLIGECLAEAGLELQDLDAVAVSRGPGSFTGLRIGASVAKGIVYALDKPLITVDTLQALAAGLGPVDHPKPIFVPMIDARRMEVYAAIYDRDLKNIQPPHALILQENLFEEWLQKGHQIILCGNGAGKGSAFFQHASFSLLPTVCSAENMLGIAYQLFTNKEFSDPAYYKPFYLKPPNITKPKKVF